MSYVTASSLWFLGAALAQYCPCSLGAKIAALRCDPHLHLGPRVMHIAVPVRCFKPQDFQQLSYGELRPTTVLTPYGALQEKLLALFTSPEPLYFGYRGY